MKVKELLEKIEELRKDLPDIDNMEIGPVFHDDTIMYISKLTIAKGAAWEDEADAIGIIWMC